jgi:hypothetical protein
VLNPALLLLALKTRVMVLLQPLLLSLLLLQQQGEAAGMAGAFQ